MPNRNFDESVLFRSMVKEFVDSARIPSIEKAIEFVNARCAEQNIIAPHPSTIRKLLKQNGVSTTRWAWKHKRD